MNFSHSQIAKLPKFKKFLDSLTQELNENEILHINQFFSNQLQDKQFASWLNKNYKHWMISSDLFNLIRTIEEYLIIRVEAKLKTSFWKLPHLNALISLLGFSGFLKRKLFVNPALYEAVLSDIYMEKVKPVDQMLSEAYDYFGKKEVDVDDVKKSLRDYKYIEYFRITLRDLGGLGSSSDKDKDILTEISNISMCLITLAFKVTTQKINGANSFIVSKKELQQTLPFCVIGMGKQGGHELNYSSDIDPIFLASQSSFDTYGSTNLIKNARFFINLLGENTADGFVHRVDMRLRPGGERAPLVLHVDDAEIYYVSKAKLWERQAMIKANYITGDIGVWKQFRSMLTHFVYSKYISENTVDEIRNIKIKIEAQHLKEQHLNIKLGVGGIREVEFFTQIFQLLFGGHINKLRQTSTIGALTVLHELEKIDTKDFERMKNGYYYLRKLENRLQMIEERQTHTVPNELHHQNAIARNMGYHKGDNVGAREAFINDLKDVMSYVRSIFSGLFSQEHLELVAAVLNHSEVAQKSDEYAETIDDFARQLSSIIKQSKSSDVNLKFQQLFERIGSQMVYYEILNKRPSSLYKMYRIAETSQLLWEYLINHLELIRQLETTGYLRNMEHGLSILREILSQYPDTDEKVDKLIQFKHTISFLLGSAELEGLLGFRQVREGLTLLADVVLQGAYEIAYNELAVRYGEPVCSEGVSKLAIVGMGKHGAYELNYHSDLDLIFIYSDFGEPDLNSKINPKEFFIKVAKRLISILSVSTQSGYAYKIDTRLRPGGNSGALVSSLEGFKTYHKRSKPWEHQALIKARTVAGSLDKAWQNRMDSLLVKTAFDWEIPASLKEEISHLRKRKQLELSGESGKLLNIKEGFGGLLDVEFLVQFKQLVYGKKHPNLQVQQTIKAIGELTDIGVFDENESMVLTNGYLFLRQLESFTRLLFDEASSMINFKTTNLELVQMLFAKHDIAIKDLYSFYLKTTKDIRLVYESFMVPF